MMIDYTPIYETFKKGHMSLLYEVMYPGLLRYAAVTLGDELAYLAEDCVQDAVMATYERRSTFADTEHWRRYMILSIRNRALKVVRHKDVCDNYADSLAAEPDTDTERDISHALIHQEMLDTLYAAIDSLPRMYREIFEMSFEQGMRNGEIARLLDVAEITVKKRKERLIAMLRTRLGGMSSLDLMALLMELRLFNEAM